MRKEITLILNKEKNEEIVESKSYTVSAQCVLLNNYEFIIFYKVDPNKEESIKEEPDLSGVFSNLTSLYNFIINGEKIAEMERSIPDKETQDAFQLDKNEFFARIKNFKPYKDIEVVYDDLLQKNADWLSSNKLILNNRQPSGEFAGWLIFEE